MNKLPLKLQFFAEESDKPKENSKPDAMGALQHIMDAMPNIEDFSDDFDTVKKAMKSLEGNPPSAGDTESYDWEGAYNKLKSEYVKRFGEYTEQRIEVEFGSEDKKPNYSNMNFSMGWFGGTTE